MKVYADLHVHIGRAENGKPIKITASKDLNFKNIAIESLEQKGIQIVGIVDCASPYVISDIEKFLETEDAVELEKGGIIYKNAVCIFLASEIETVELREDGTKGYAHSVCYFPYLNDIKNFSNIMSKYIKNITLSTQKANLSAYELLQIVEGCNGVLVPAHIFTPYKSFYGNATDKLEYVFKDKSDNIKAVELGLSADNYLASMISEINDKIYLTNSDAHSLPKIAREYNELELEDISFESFRKLIDREKDESGNINNFVVRNYGLDPKLGKYHRTYCDNCEENRKIVNGVCESCKSKKIVKGVYDRILELQDQAPIKDSDKYIYQVPLEFLPGIGRKTMKKLLDDFGTEMNILHNIPIDNIEAEYGIKIAKQIQELREGTIELESGGGGVYGKVKRSE